MVEGESSPVESVEPVVSPSAPPVKVDGRTKAALQAKWGEDYDLLKKVRAEGGRAFGGQMRKRKARREVDGEGFLRDMRFVLLNDPKHDRSVGEKAMRNLLDKKPIEFMDKMRELEGEGGKSAIADSGTDRVEALIERLLKEGVGDVG